MEGVNPRWFGARLRELREAAGLTQQALADRAGLKKGSIGQLEWGRYRPAWDTVIALCRALEVDCSAFCREPKDQAPRPRGRPGRRPKAGEGG